MKFNIVTDGDVSLSIYYYCTRVGIKCTYNIVYYNILYS